VPSTNWRLSRVRVARDHVHVFLGYRPNQDVRQIMQWLKGISSRVL
jgi:putative transposase